MRCFALLEVGGLGGGDGESLGVQLDAVGLVGLGVDLILVDGSQDDQAHLFEGLLAVLTV